MTINVPYILGLNKMVINQLEKLFVTSDAATVIKELEVKKC
jgi:chaperonin GroEL (HSP60 family)